MNAVLPAAGLREVQFLLYMNGDFSSAYWELHLYLTVTYILVFHHPRRDAYHQGAKVHLERLHRPLREFDGEKESRGAIYRVLTGGRSALLTASHGAFPVEMSRSIDRQAETKMMIIASSTAQVSMFTSIVRAMPDWDVLLVNVNVHQRGQMEEKLEGVGTAHVTFAPWIEKQALRFLRLEHPSVVVLGNDCGPIERLFIHAAKQNGIATILVQDGVLAPSAVTQASAKNERSFGKRRVVALARVIRFALRTDLTLRDRLEVVLFDTLQMRSPKPVKYGHGGCDWIAVFGNATKRLFIAEGVEAKRIVTTGNPKFDKLVALAERTCRDSVCHRFNIPHANTIILLITQDFVEIGLWTPAQRGHFVRTIWKACSHFQNARLIIKLHPPLEREEDYLDIVGALEPAPKVCKDYPTEELVCASDIVLSVSSTVLLEALAIQKHVVVVDLFGDEIAGIYSQSGAAFARNENELLAELHKAAGKKPETEEERSLISTFVREHVGPMDGLGSIRIAALISRVAGGQGPSSSGGGAP